MSSLETWTLWGHVAAGVVALAAGAVALATKKGGLRHRRAGSAFVASMAGVVGTTFLLLGFDVSSFRVFLALVAVFSGYFAFSGYRVLARKRPADGAAAVDWAAAATVVVACVALAAWGVSWYLQGDVFGVVMAVFGGIGVTFGGIDLRRFHAGAQPGWMVTHLQRMLGAYVAVVSAVSAVNLTPRLGVLAWLWPTILGVPLIVYWSRKYE